jgi:hypothetical protein
MFNSIIPQSDFDSESDEALSPSENKSVHVQFQVPSEPVIF